MNAQAFFLNYWGNLLLWDSLGQEILPLARGEGNALSHQFPMKINYDASLKTMNILSTVQSLSCGPNLCDPVDYSTPGPLSFTISWGCLNSCSLSQWCYLTTSSSAVPFPSCPQSFPTSGSFPMSRLFSKEVAKVLELQHQHQSFQWIFSINFLNAIYIIGFACCHNLINISLLLLLLSRFSCVWLCVTP